MSARKRVLVIDSDSKTCGLIADTLGPKGFEVFPFADPDEGVAKAAEIRPDLVFISILFSGSNGLKISRAVHSVEGLQKVPVIMLISYADELDPKYTSTIGIVDVIQKPVSAEEILSKTVVILGEGTVPEEGKEKTPEVAVTEEADAASLDEEWMTFLDTEDREKAEAQSAETPPDEEPAGEPIGAAEAASPGAEEDTVDNTTEFLREEERQVPEPAYEEEPQEVVAGSQGRPMKKFLFMAVVVVVFVVGAGIGAYLFFQGRGSVITRPVAKVPVKKAPAAVADRNVTPPEKPATTTQAPAAAKAVTAAPPASQKAATPTANEAPRKAKETYSVQVGAFQNGKNAAALADKLKKNGYDAFVLDEPGKPVHRVLIGRFDSRKEAAAEAKRLVEREGLKSIIFGH
jgi:twitching motility two-component system response regulator PilG